MKEFGSKRLDYNNFGLSQWNSLMLLFVWWKTSFSSPSRDGRHEIEWHFNIESFVSFFLNVRTFGYFRASFKWRSHLFRLYFQTKLWRTQVFHLRIVLYVVSYLLYAMAATTVTNEHIYNIHIQHTTLFNPIQPIKHKYALRRTV